MSVSMDITDVHRVMSPQGTVSDLPTFQHSLKTLAIWRPIIVNGLDWVLFTVGALPRLFYASSKWKRERER